MEIEDVNTTRDDHEGEYYCGICGWVSIEIFPNCHATQEEESGEKAK